MIIGILVNPDVMRVFFKEIEKISIELHLNV